MFMNLALKYEIASKIMPYTYFPVLLSFIIDIIVFHVSLSFTAVLGSLLIAASVLGPALVKK